MSQSDAMSLELRVDTVDPATFAPLLEALGAAGVSFTTLRDLQSTESAWCEKFTELDNATRDLPVPRSVEAIRERLAELALDADACFVARARGEWIGYTLLDTAHSDAERLHQSWTGVIPAYRRRGIATALKVLTIRYAKEHRYKVIVTTPRADNMASQGMNRRLGFES
jgi:RimJ/RimL family protein N-acetyltransferase